MGHLGNPPGPIIINGVIQPPGSLRAGFFQPTDVVLSPPGTPRDPINEQAPSNPNPVGGPGPSNPVNEVFSGNDGAILSVNFNRTLPSEIASPSSSLEQGLRASSDLNFGLENLAAISGVAWENNNFIKKISGVTGPSNSLNVNLTYNSVQQSLLEMSKLSVSDLSELKDSSELVGGAPGNPISSRPLSLYTITRLADDEPIPDSPTYHSDLLIWELRQEIKRGLTGVAP